MPEGLDGSITDKGVMEAGSAEAVRVVDVDVLVRCCVDVCVVDIVGGRLGMGACGKEWRCVVQPNVRAKSC